MIGGWKGYLAAGLALAAVAGFAYVQTIRLRAANIETARERDRADANAATIKAMVADAERSNRIVADLAADLAAAQEAARNDRTAIVRADRTSVCGAAPAMRVLLDGVRRDQGAADAARPPGAGGTGAAVPDRAPGPGTGRQR